MDMQMEVRDELVVAIERLAQTAAQLEHAAGRIAGVDLNASLERATAHEAELEQRLAEAEGTIAGLRAEAARVRKTTPATVASLVAREAAPATAGALDAALRSLSVEQRITVKSELMRAGLIA